MPIYEYECAKCKSRIEVFQKMNDKPPAKCKKCGGRMEKQLSAPAIQFKGSGWYVTDYAGSGASKKAAEKSEREATVTGESKSEKTDKKSKESSPAKKTSEKASTPKSKGD
jgi:putative FmdB family regulatory protein